jgi:tRNA-binding protein
VKTTADFAAFLALDIRVGTIVSVQPGQTKKPTWRMTIEFGPEAGTRVSCGAYTNYDAAALVGKQVVAVINFAPKKMGPETSEALILGVQSPEGPGTVLLTIDQPAPNGSEIF